MIARTHNTCRLQICPSFQCSRDFMWLSCARLCQKSCWRALEHCLQCSNRCHRCVVQPKMAGFTKLTWVWEGTSSIGGHHLRRSNAGCRNGLCQCQTQPQSNGVVLWSKRLGGVCACLLSML